MVQTSSSPPSAHLFIPGRGLGRLCSLNWSSAICWAGTPEVGVSLRATARSQMAEREVTTSRLSVLRIGCCGERLRLGRPRAPLRPGTAWGATPLTSLGLVGN